MSDRNEIEDVLSRFMWARDERDIEAARQCFDDVVRVASGEGAGRAGLQSESRDSLIDAIAHDKAVVGTEQHHHTNLLIEVSGDNARVRCNLLVQGILEPSASSVLGSFGAKMEYSLRRTADGWRITGIEAQPVWSGEYAVNHGQAQ